ncbi:MAG: hypothetical protein ABJC89_06860 [Acidobacteriota bacterium]
MGAPLAARRSSNSTSHGADERDALPRLERLRSAIQPDGAVWVIRPKGRQEITEADVMAAGKHAGLVDVKVVSFFSTHTAEKFVIPVRLRPAVSCLRGPGTPLTLTRKDSLS